MSEYGNTPDNPVVSTVPQPVDYSTASGEDIHAAVTDLFRAGEQPQRPFEAEGQDGSADRAGQEHQESGLQIPDKFRDADGQPNVQKILQSYTELERAFHSRKPQEQGQPDLAQMEAAYQQQLMQIQQQAHYWQQQAILQQQQYMQQAQPEDDAQSVENQISDALDAMTPEDAEAWFETFYVNPKAAMAELVQSIINPVLQPFVEQRQFEAEYVQAEQSLSALAEKYQDFAEVLPYMEAVLPTLPPEFESLPDSADMLYQVARGQYLQQLVANAGQATSPGRQQLTPEQIAQMPDVQRQVLSQYATQLKQQSPPPVMGSRPGVGMPVAESQQINTINEGGKLAEQWLRQAMRAT